MVKLRSNFELIMKFIILVKLEAFAEWWSASGNLRPFFVSLINYNHALVEWFYWMIFVNFDFCWRRWNYWRVDLWCAFLGNFEFLDLFSSFTSLSLKGINGICAVPYGNAISNALTNLILKLQCEWSLKFRLWIQSNSISKDSFLPLYSNGLHCLDRFFAID